MELFPFCTKAFDIYEYNKGRPKPQLLVQNFVLFTNSNRWEKLRLREEIVGSNFLLPDYTQQIVVLSRDLGRRQAVSCE
jgi:hypothetical protein